MSKGPIWLAVASLLGSLFALGLAISAKRDLKVANPKEPTMAYAATVLDDGEPEHRESPPQATQRPPSSAGREFRGTWAYWGPRIKECESHNNYQADNPRSTASGAWQITDVTWNGHGGYQRAKDAPPAIQDEKALLLYRASGLRPWRACVR